jgi:hypothetical protein
MGSVFETSAVGAGNVYSLHFRAHWGFYTRVSSFFAWHGMATEPGCSFLSFGVGTFHPSGLEDFCHFACKYRKARAFYYWLELLFFFLLFQSSIV